MKNIVKIISLALAFTVIVTAMLTSCGKKENAVDLLREIKVDRVKENEISDDAANALADAFVKLFKSTLSDDKKSSLISPFSIFAALGMTADGTAGNTLEEFEELFGMSASELDEAMAYLSFRLGDTGSSNVKFRTADSIWLTNTGVKFKTSYLERVKSYYDPSVYSVDFSDSATVDAINGWVKNNTDDMIEKIIEYGDVDASTVAALVNAITFDAKWAEKFSKVSDGVFTSYSGQEQNVTMMYSSGNRCYMLDGAVGISKDYDGGKYRFVALLPDEKTDVFDFVRTLDGETILSLSDREMNMTARVGMPKFSLDYDLDLIPSLVSLGVVEAFGGAADFSEMAECRPGDIFIDQAIHKTHIDIDENGTKAAAATIVTTRKNAVAEQEIVLDRPFIYMIIDAESSLPVFMGVMTDVDTTKGGGERIDRANPFGNDTGEKDYSIRLSGNESDVVSAPKNAKGGETVEIKTVILYDADIEVYVDGEKIEKSHYDSDCWIYSFIMPEHDVEVNIKPVSGWKQKSGGTTKDDISEKIKADYVKKHQSDEVTTDTLTLRFFGEFDGSYALFVDGPFVYLCVLTSETVDGVTINYSDSHHMTIYRDGEFYTLGEAFDAGYITHDDLVAIRNAHAEQKPFLYGEY